MFRYFRSREEAKMRWIHDTSQSNVDNLTNVKREINRHFRNIKEYLKDEIEELQTGRSKTLGTGIGSSVTLRRVTSLELI